MTAAPAAKAALAAAQQGKFWEMHDAIFATQDLLSDDLLKGHAKALGLDLSRAQVTQIAGSEHFDECVAEYVRLRSHKGVTAEIAREKMLDVSYFGTMLVQLGFADGMVSGATHTTAETIRPALEVIKTVPEVERVFGKAGRAESAYAAAAADPASGAGGGVDTYA